jgi:thioredoxin reductase (NADPH)
LGHGVSVCATCDAPFFRNKDVIVVGGGNSAMVEADHLSKLATSITIVNNLDELTANDALKFKVLENPKVTIKNHTIIKEIQGDSACVTQVVIEDVKNNATSIIKTDGVFVAIGMAPNSKLFKGVLEMDANGYLIVKPGMQTSKPGVFAAGEVADPQYRQAITSAGFGCMAALDCQRYLNANSLFKCQHVVAQQIVEDYLRN